MSLLTDLTCFLKCGHLSRQCDAAIQRDLSMGVPHQLYPGHPLTRLVVHNPESSLQKDQTHILTPAWPLHIVLRFLLPVGCIHLKEGRGFIAVEGRRNARHSEVTAVPLRLAGPCLNSSAGGVAPVALGPRSPSPKEESGCTRGETVWCARGAGGWAPLILAEMPLCCKQHLPNSPGRGNKGTGCYKWEPQPPERALWKERAGNQVAFGEL